MFMNYYLYAVILVYILLVGHGGVYVNSQISSLHRDTDDIIDSDNLFLYVNQSSLPDESAGLGVFAKVDIPAGEILCEYRGPTSKNGFATRPSDKLFSVTTMNEIEYVIDGNNICSVVNDAVLLSAEPPYTKDELRTYLASKYRNSIPTHPGFEYNAYYNETRMGKLFLVSLTDIKANSEIFYSYGK